MLAILVPFLSKYTFSFEGMNTLPEYIACMLPVFHLALAVQELL